MRYGTMFCIILEKNTIKCTKKYIYAYIKLQLFAAIATSWPILLIFELKHCIVLHN